MSPRLLLFTFLYFVSGISLTFFNKWLLSPAHFGFSFPIFLILFHMTLSFILSSATMLAMQRSDPNYANLLEHHPLAPANVSFPVWLHKFVPIGALFGCDILLTNVSFRYVAVSLTEVIKSGIPAILLVHSLISRRRASNSSSTSTYSLYHTLTVAILCTGILLTSLGDMSFDVRGFFAAIGATGAGAVKLLLIETLLHETAVIKAPNASSSSPAASVNGLDSCSTHRLPPMVSLYYFCPISSVLLFIAFIGLELIPVIHSGFFSSGENAILTLSLVLSSGIIAFLFNLFELFLIQETSALSLCVLGVLKFLFVVLISIFAFEGSYDRLSDSNRAGLVLAFCGVLLYNYIKYREVRGHEPAANNRIGESGKSGSLDGVPHLKLVQSPGVSGVEEEEIKVELAAMGGNFEIGNESDYDEGELVHFEAGEESFDQQQDDEPELKAPSGARNGQQNADKPIKQKKLKGAASAAVKYSQL